MGIGPRLHVFAALSLICASAYAATDFVIAYTPGERDASGSFFGGTELRALAAHGGALFAGIGYWEDRPGPEGPQSAAVLVRDNFAAPWRVEHVSADRLPNGAWRDLAISALRSVTFSTDGSGHRLSMPVSMLLASSWDRAATLRVFSRDDATRTWTPMVLAQDHPRPDFLPQVRSLAVHHDAVTGVDRVFAGADPDGVYSGIYDPAVPGRIRWDGKPELDARIAASDNFPGLRDRLRISSFAECNGRLYAAVGQQVFERLDGAPPRWRLIYTNPHPVYSQTGLRGLTAIANPNGPGQVLLAAVEGDNARIVRIDPSDGSEATDLDLGGFLDRAWQTHVSYVIAAYNDMTRVAGPRGEILLIGFEAFIPPRSSRPPGHVVLDVVHGLEAGGWFLVRYSDGRYELRQVTASVPGIGTALVAVRAMLASPFPDEAGSVYFGGYDANGVPAHNTAWLVRADAATLFGGTAKR